MKSEALRQARSCYNRTRIRWGFIWAIWAAVLAGAWYVPGTAIWSEAPFAGLDPSVYQTFITAAVLITALNAVTIVLCLAVWITVLEKWKDVGRTLVRFRTISKWYFAAAFFGGIVANFGAYLAMGYVGGVFAAASALLYPIVGATLARLWYYERITRRAAVGIFIIIAGGVTIYLPGLAAELGGAGAGGAAWIGYVGGALTAIGWGVEGAVAGRILDVTDPDSGLMVRFIAENIFWLLVILPALLLFTEVPLWPLLTATLSDPRSMTWLLLAGVSYGFCQVAWYKSFPLIGVGRGQVIGDLYAPFAVLFLAVFTLTLPDWHFVVGLVLAVFGGFVMYTERAEVLEVLRALPADRSKVPARDSVL